MKSYIQGLITGSVLVFSFFVLIGGSVYGINDLMSEVNNIEYLVSDLETTLGDIESTLDNVESDVSRVQNILLRYGVDCN